MSKVGITKEMLLAITRTRLETEQQVHAKHLRECMPVWLNTVKVRVIQSASDYRRTFVNIPTRGFALVISPSKWESGDVRDIIDAINESGEGFRANSETAHPDCKCSDPHCADPTIHIRWA